MRLTISDKNKLFNKISIAINIFWGVAFIPSSFICLLVGFFVLTAVTTTIEDGVYKTMNPFFGIMFWSIPVWIVISVILSITFRSKAKYIRSILIQFMPIIIVIIMIFILYIGQMYYMGVFAYPPEKVYYS